MSKSDEPYDDSVTRQLAGLKAGDPAAANELTLRYFTRVVRAAEKRLDRRTSYGGAEDVAASVFESIWERAATGRFGEQDLIGRDDFWRLLCHMLERKVVDHRRKATAAKRGGGTIRGESVFRSAGDGNQPRGIDEVAGQTFSPHELAAFAERHARLMAALDDEILQEVATLRLEGYEIEEIAGRLDVSGRTIKRKLNLVRETWRRELGDDAPPES